MSTARIPSGSTGITWNPKYIKTPPTSISELWNPAYAGHVGMMSDPQEIANFGLFKIGVNPETSTEADWKNAASALMKQKSAGLLAGLPDRRFPLPVTCRDGCPGRAIRRPGSVPRQGSRSPGHPMPAAGSRGPGCARRPARSIPARWRVRRPGTSGRRSARRRRRRRR